MTIWTNTLVSLSVCQIVSLKSGCVMLLTLSSELCTSNDRFRNPNKFSNHLPFPIVISEHVNGGPNYYLKLEGISIDPWPTKPVLICVSLCEPQPCGMSMLKSVSMIYEKGKFTQPKVPAKLGESQEIVIEVITVEDIAVPVRSVTLQLSLLPV